MKEEKKPITLERRVDIICGELGAINTSLSKSYKNFYKFIEYHNNHNDYNRAKITSILKILEKITPYIQIPPEVEDEIMEIKIEANAETDRVEKLVAQNRKREALHKLLRRLAALLEELKRRITPPEPEAPPETEQQKTMRYANELNSHLSQIHRTEDRINTLMRRLDFNQRIDVGLLITKPFPE